MKKDHIVIIIILSLILLYFLTGCKAKTVYDPVHSTTTVTELLRDTIVDIRLQTFRDSVNIPDTLSRLENKYAYSTALWSSGRLSHSLGIKPVNIPVEIQYKEVIRVDSVAVPYPVVEEKTVYRLRWWQESLMWIGIATFAFALLRAGWQFLKKKFLI